MSSLRLALKQSLEETSASTPPPHPPQPQALPSTPAAAAAAAAGRTSPHAASGSLSSVHTLEEDNSNTSPVPKKRGPGRPRKYPRSNNDHPQQPRKRGRPRKNNPPTMSDEDAFSSENEFSVGGGDPYHESNEHEPHHGGHHHHHSAATKIQSHWKKSKGKPSFLLQDSAVAEPPSRSKPEEAAIYNELLSTTSAVARQQQQPSQEDSVTTTSATPVPAPATNHQSKPVTPPAQDVIDWMRNMPVKRARKAVAQGLRVKVRFVTKMKKEGKVTRKRIWYGGRITAVSKEGSKIRIKYDDKTSEVTQFPDKDVVIDDYLNGKHQANANKFIPPEQHDDDDDDDDEDIFGEVGTARHVETVPHQQMEKHVEKPREPQPTRPMEVEDAKPKAETSGYSSKIFSVETAELSESKLQVEKDHASDKPKPSVVMAEKDMPQPFSETLALKPSLPTVDLETETKSEAQTDFTAPDKVDEQKPTPEEAIDELDSAGEPLTTVADLASLKAEDSKLALTETVEPKEAVITSELPAIDALPPEASEIVAEVNPVKPPNEDPIASQNQVPAQAEMDSNANAADNVLVAEGADKEEAVVPSIQEIPVAQTQVERAEKPSTEPAEIEEVSKGEESKATASVLQEEKPAAFPKQTEEITQAVEETSEPSAAVPSMTASKETTPETEKTEAPSTEPDVLGVQGARAEKEQPTVEEATKVEGNVDEQDRKDESEQTSSQNGEVQPPASSDSLPSAVIEAFGTPDSEGVDGLTTSKEAEVDIVVLDATVAPEEITKEKGLKAETEPTAIDALVLTKAVESTEDAQAPITFTDEPANIPVTAAKTDLPPAATETGEEPAKPKRKRGRPPKHRPPTDGAAQEKGQKTEKGLASTESSGRGVEKPIGSNKSAFSEISERETTTTTAGKTEGNETTNKPSLTIRISNLKKVDGKQGTNVKKGDTKPETDADVSHGKKRSHEGAEGDEPPSKRLHIHIGSKGSQENLSDYSERSTEKGASSRSDAGTNSKKVISGTALAKEPSGLSPKPKKAKRKRERDLDSTPGDSSKPGKNPMDVGDTTADSRKTDHSSQDGEAQESKPGQDPVDDKFGTPDVRIKPDLLSAARSGRRAAQQANERISSKNDPPADQAAKKKKKRRRDMDQGETELDDQIPAFQWVQCDKCAKWRIIPSSVVETLPPKWYCANNKWDAKRASCDAPEQTPKQVAKERKKKKRKLMMEREAAEAAEREAAAAGDTAMDVSSSPPNNEEAPEPQRASPSENSFDSKHGSDVNKAGKKSVSSSKKIKHLSSSVVETTAVPEEEPKPRGRGRPRRNPPKEVSAPSAPPTNSQNSAPPATDEGDNLEWVQCEKCDKWRKLPPHISADELPDVWYCTMNTWNPGSASCSAPEDKADGLQDIFNNNATSGKLSYRNLIFGSNGRKHNRPISERTRAAESLFAAVSDDSDAPPTVMYANSSAFVCRGKNQQSDENEGPSVLDLMSRSYLWTQLQKTQSKATPLVFDALSTQDRESLKDIVLHCLGTQTLTGNELHEQVGERNWENAPVGWAAVRKYCSENMLVMAMCELVRMGVLECFRRDGPLPNGQLWTLCYRRARTHSPAPAIPATAPKVDLPSNGRRCMKFAKPWKKPHVAS